MGHTVLAIPVPGLEDVVRERTQFYDPSFVSDDPGFVHAHITVLGPWVADPTTRDLARIGELARETAPFEITLAEVGEFPDGTIHLVPSPDDELRRLTDQVAVAYPDYLPYGGQFADVAPHLTLDRRSEAVTREGVAVSVSQLLPLRLTVDRIDLQWWANDDCRLLASWSLG